MVSPCSLPYRRHIWVIALHLQSPVLCKFSFLICVTSVSGLDFRYLAPEYFMHGIVDEKTDVFAFGVLLLELITGRHAVDSARQSLVIWVRFIMQTHCSELP